MPWFGLAMEGIVGIDRKDAEGRKPAATTATTARKHERVEAVVTVVIEEFELVHADTVDGDTLSIGARTRGVDWRDLRIGQRLACQVEIGPLPRVLSAEVIDPPAAQD